MSTKRYSLLPINSPFFSSNPPFTNLNSTFRPVSKTSSTRYIYPKPLRGPDLWKQGPRVHRSLVSLSDTLYDGRGRRSIGVIKSTAVRRGSPEGPRPRRSGRTKGRTQRSRTGKYYPSPPSTITSSSGLLGSWGTLPLSLPKLISTLYPLFRLSLL